MHAYVSVAVLLASLATARDDSPPPPLSTRFSSLELYVSPNSSTCATEQQRSEALELISRDVREQLAKVPEIFIDCDKYHIGRAPHCAVDNCSEVFDRLTQEDGLMNPSGYFWLKLPDGEPRKVFCNRETGYPEMPSCALIFIYHPTAESGYYTLLLNDGVRSRVFCDRETGQPQPESCAHAHQLELPSGYYILRPPPDYQPLGYTVRCDMDHEECGSRWWTEVVSRNFSDETTPCPEAWQTRMSPVRGCYRTTENGCNSVKYSTHGHNYTRVCGRITAYQQGAAFGFLPSTYVTEEEEDSVIDGNYVNGVSVTHGEAPREHIWSFAASLDYNFCRCNDENATHPTFVGQHYFCESKGSHPDDPFHLQNPLWDGKGCTYEDGCCTFNNPPWFSAVLPSSTNEDIEVRLCGVYDINNYTIPITLLEIFVQ